MRCGNLFPRRCRNPFSAPRCECGRCFFRLRPRFTFEGLVAIAEQARKYNQAARWNAQPGATGEESAAAGLISRDPPARSPDTRRNSLAHQLTYPGDKARRSWQPQTSTSHNALPWRASPASAAAHGSSGIQGPRFLLSSTILEVGASIGEIMEWFHLSREQVVSVIEFAARSLDAPLLAPPAHTVEAHPL